MTTFKVGDLVRLPGRRKGNSTGFRQGRVVEVIGFGEDYPEQLTVQAPVGAGYTMLRQWLTGKHVRLAKQAMKKRAAYAARRGGPLEIPSALVSADLAAAEQRWAHP